MFININGHQFDVSGDEALFVLLDKMDEKQNAETWINASGSTLCLLKSGEQFLLMYVGDDGSSFLSDSGELDSTVVEFTLLNGQVDEFARQHCVPKEQAYKAFAYFFVNSGERYPYVEWKKG